MLQARVQNLTETPGYHGRAVSKQSPQAPLSCFLPQVTLGLLCWLVFSFASLHLDIQLNPAFRHPNNTDASLLWTMLFVPGNSPYIFSKFNPLDTDTR